MFQHKFFERPVYYLQRSDFDENGNLVEPFLRNKKVIIMIQSNNCGHCTNAKPAFLEAAKFVSQRDPNVVFATIQADGKERGEQELNELLGQIKPDFRGFPDYVLYLNGRRYDSNGPPGRDSRSIINYVLS